MVMNTKGASASGKSTLRPLQKKLAGDIGVDWSEFALISPDIWRKQLARLRLARATRTSTRAPSPATNCRSSTRSSTATWRRKATARRHVAPADRSLPLRQLRAALGRSRQQPADALRPHRLPVLHDHAAGVARRARVEPRARGRPVQGSRRHAGAQRRGLLGNAGALLHVGRCARTSALQFEFLDNSVAQGERPRTVAFGSNDVLNVLDVRCLLDVERYPPGERRRSRARVPVRRSDAARSRAQHRRFCATASASFATSISPTRRPAASTCISLQVFPIGPIRRCFGGRWPIRMGAPGCWPSRPR